jgi:hypothetical protein
MIIKPMPKEMIMNEVPDFDLVEIINGTPHCKVHGAMNKLPAHNLWRCFAQYRGNPDGRYPPWVTPVRFRDRVCEACCIQVEE